MTQSEEWASAEVYHQRAVQPTKLTTSGLDRWFIPRPGPVLDHHVALNPCLQLVQRLVDVERSNTKSACNGSKPIDES